MYTNILIYKMHDEIVIWKFSYFVVIKEGIYMLKRISVSVRFPFPIEGLGRETGLCTPSLVKIMDHNALVT